MEDKKISYRWLNIFLPQTWQEYVIEKNLVLTNTGDRRGHCTWLLVLPCSDSRNSLLPKCELSKLRISRICKP